MIAIPLPYGIQEYDVYLLEKAKGPLAIDREGKKFVMKPALTSRQCSKKRLHGLTLIEVLLAAFIFLMMALMLASVLPAAARNTRYSATYSQAVALCQRKMDQLQEAGWGKLNEADLRALGIIDSNVGTTDGAATLYSFTQNDSPPNNNNADNITSFFPGGTNVETRVLGTIRVEPWESGYVTVNGNLEPSLMKVTVRIAWREAKGGQSSFSMTSLISRMTVE